MTPGAMLLARVVAQSRNALGYDKQRIRRFLWEQSKITQSQLRRVAGRAWLKIAGIGSTLAGCAQPT